MHQLSLTNLSLIQQFFKVAVIGSGPSGVACAYSLLKQKGVKVDMLDTGFNIEPDIAHLENNKETVCAKTILKKVKEILNKKIKNKKRRKIYG